MRAIPRSISDRYSPGGRSSDKRPRIARWTECHCHMTLRERLVLERVSMLLEIVIKLLMSSDVGMLAYKMDEG